MRAMLFFKAVPTTQIMRFLLLAFSLLSVSCSETQVVNGFVKDTNTLLPISGAKVILGEEGASAITNSSGSFSIVSAVSSSGKPTGIRVEHSLYWAKNVPLALASASNVDVKLQAKKQRLVITTDIGGVDPDDLQSLLHALLLSNEFDLEGIIYGHSWMDSDLELGRQRIASAIDAYAKVFPNLMTHADGYPAPEYLRSIVKPGQAGLHVAGTGEGKDSEGSNLIISTVNNMDDPRPVWLNAWGGANTIAQAYWKIKNIGSPESIKQFVNKVRVYDILGQDDAGSWIAKTFPDAFYIRNSGGVYGWAPSNSWIAENVQSHGPLGELYPTAKWAFEGDSPSFFHVASRGLNNPDELTQGGWGGRFGPDKQTGVKLFSWAEKNAAVNAHDQKLRPYALYTNTAEGTDSIKKWQADIHNSLAARMDWTIQSTRAEANHFPVAVVNGDNTRQILDVAVKPGEQVILDASGSRDPDGDKLKYAWQFYAEASSYDGDVAINGSDSVLSRITIPADASGKSIHVILVVHDAGLPSLAAYRRLILNVQ